MSAIADLHILNAKIRDDINKTASTRRAIAVDNAADFKVTAGSNAESVQQTVSIAPRANFTVPFPALPESFNKDSDLTKLRGLLDLEKVIVVTGFAEVGPFGSSRTRWEMEAKGEFSIEGLLELAFTLGLIKHFNGRLKSGAAYVGWVDAKSEEPIDDKDVRGKYEKHILEHTGVRLIGKACLPR
jgi:fatty acid synthase subunit alpha